MSAEPDGPFSRSGAKSVIISEHGQAIYKTLRWTPYRRSDGVGLTTWTEPVTADEAEVPPLRGSG
ncbi:hypothetical protein AB0937_30780 [Streptomyces sp. NPDC047880]|uniref:hypothetical protein n=1 Tax=Streptomyces sp. NPDC047880 TaxID=3155626 RepID=UPI00345163A7